MKQHFEKQRKEITHSRHAAKNHVSTLNYVRADPGQSREKLRYRYIDSYAFACIHGPCYTFYFSAS